MDARPVLVAAANALREVDLEAVHATILRPYYPVSDLFRVVRDSDGLQLDFMATVHGLRSFEGVRDRARLTDIIKSKRAAARPQDLAVLPLLEQAREAAEQDAKSQTRRAPKGK